MNRVKRKLNSERGASITWALLIFLVCAVVGSVVLVAGTSASGRLSKLAETDQRYYAVSSSAGVLRDVLGQSVTVKRTVSVADDVKTYKIDYGTSPDKIIKSLVMELMTWPDATAAGTTNENLFWTVDAPALPSAKTVQLRMTGEGDLSTLGVTGSLSLGPDGSILAEISKGNFRMQLTFELNRTITTVDNEKTDVFTWKLKDAKTMTA